MDVLAEQQPQLEYEEIPCYTAKKGKWHLLKGDCPDDSEAIDDLGIDFVSIKSISVQQATNDFGPVDRIQIHLDRETSDGIEEIRVISRITPNQKRDWKTQKPILDEYGEPIYSIAWAAISLLNGLVQLNQFSQGLANAKGRLVVKKGTSGSYFVNVFALNEQTNKLKQMHSVRLGVEAEEDGSRDVEDAIATLQHMNGFRVAPYPIPVQAIESMRGLASSASPVLQPA